MPGDFLVRDVAINGPATHALVIGVGDYPHLLGGSGTRSGHADGMGQLTSPPHSARAFAKWLAEEYRNADKPLATIAMLISERPQDASISIANSENVKKAFEQFLARGDTSPGNMLILYFCGHGICEGTDYALLLSDYGKDRQTPLEGAIDFRKTRLGMQRCQARQQCFFIDACRQSTDTIINSQDGYAGRVFAGGGPRPVGLPQWKAPVFYSTLNEEKSYARPGSPSIFTDALIRALDGIAAGDDEGDWRVSTVKLFEALDHLSSTEAAQLRKSQVPNSDDFSNFYLHYPVQDPKALVYFHNEQEDFSSAHLSYNVVGELQKSDAPTTLRKREQWGVLLSPNAYDFSLTFSGRQPISFKNKHIRPVFRKIPVT